MLTASSSVESLTFRWIARGEAKMTEKIKTRFKKDLTKMQKHEV
jgi:hypothetical protein